MAEKIKNITNSFSKKNQMRTLLIFLIFSVLILTVVSAIAIKNYNDSMEILEESVSERLMSIAISAEKMINTSLFVKYNSEEDILNDASFPYDLEALKDLAKNMGALYVYAIKQVDDKFYFVYDTDEEVMTRFDEYEPTPVLLEAFNGNKGVSLYGEVDEYGACSTAAIPLYRSGKVVGVVGADIDELYLTKNKNSQMANTALLLASIFIVLAVMAVLLYIMLKRIKAMSDKLYRQAHYDKLTNLPNRQFLLEYLEEVSQGNKEKNFAVFFIDLDNFKKVNDTAGHDAGDALLKNIGSFLSTAHSNMQAFRPASGALNVAARIGGDEFILVATDLSKEQAVCYGNELIDGLKTKVKDNNIQLFSVGFSIGVAMFPEHSENFHVLLKYSDIAMYHAKRGGKNSCKMYEVDMKPKEEK